MPIPILGKGSAIIAVLNGSTEEKSIRGYRTVRYMDMEQVQGQTTSRCVVSLSDYLNTVSYRNLTAHCSNKWCNHDADKVHDLIVDHLVMKWNDIVSNWDRNQCPDFFAWVFMSFRWNVLRAYTAKSRRVARGIDVHAMTMSATDVDAKDGNGDVMSNIAERIVGVNVGASIDVVQMLQRLPVDLSYIVWNRSLGFSFADIARKLSISTATVAVRYNGALATLERYLADDIRETTIKSELSEDS